MTADDVLDIELGYRAPLATDVQRLPSELAWSPADAVTGCEECVLSPGGCCSVCAIERRCGCPS